VYKGKSEKEVCTIINLCIWHWCTPSSRTLHIKKAFIICINYSVYRRIVLLNVWVYGILVLLPHTYLKLYFLKTFKVCARALCRYCSLLERTRHIVNNKKGTLFYLIPLSNSPTFQGMFRVKVPCNSEIKWNNNDYRYEYLYFLIQNIIF